MREHLSQYVATLFNDIYSGERNIIIDDNYNISVVSEDGNMALTGGLKVIAYTLDKVQPASIFPNEINRRKRDLRLLYRIIILVEDNPSFTIEDYMNRAFRGDAEEANAENLKKI